MAPIRLASLLLVAGLAGCNASFHTEFGNGPEQAARTFLEKTARDGAAAAYADAAPEMRTVVTPAAFRALRGVFRLERYQSVGFEQSKLDTNGSTLLTGTLNERGMPSMPIEMRMAPENGGWKVLSIDIKKPTVMMVGEGSGEPGVVAGVLFSSAREVAAACSIALAPIRVPMCAHALPLTVGASTECLANQGERAIGITATSEGNNPLTGKLRIDCRESQ